MMQKKRLKNSGIEIDDKIIINGFSASAKFANRFTLLHPDKIKLVIAGGLGGCLILPLRELNGEKLIYPVGIGNVESISDEMINEFKKIKQFYFQGNRDNVDAYQSTAKDNYIPYYKGVIEEEELKQIYKFFGRDINERWLKTQKLYRGLNCNGILKTYNGSHNYTDEIVSDIKELLENQIKIR